MGNTGDFVCYTCACSIALGKYSQHRDEDHFVFNTFSKHDPERRRQTAAALLRFLSDHAGHRTAILLEWKYPGHDAVAPFGDAEAAFRSLDVPSLETYAGPILPYLFDGSEGAAERADSEPRNPDPRGTIMSNTGNLTCYTCKTMLDLGKYLYLREEGRFVFNLFAKHDPERRRSIAAALVRFLSDHAGHRTAIVLDDQVPGHDAIPAMGDDEMRFSLICSDVEEYAKSYIPYLFEDVGRTDEGKPASKPDSTNRHEPQPGEDRT